MKVSILKMQQYLDWLKQKIFLDSTSERAKSRVVSRGQVYYCYLGQGIGSEECKLRPCVVIQRDSGNRTSPNTIVAPITHTDSRLPIVVQVGEQRKDSGELLLDGNVLLGNIVTVSKARLGDYITNLTLEEMKRVDEAIAISTDINHYHNTLNNKYKDKLVYIGKLQKKVGELEVSLLDERQSIRALEQLRIDLDFKDFKEMESQIRESFSKKATE